MIGTVNNLRCKLFKVVQGEHDADKQFNTWMDEITKEYDVTIYQIDSTQSRYGCHMIFVYYTFSEKKECKTYFLNGKEKYFSNEKDSIPDHSREG